MEREFELSAQEFATLRHLVRQHAGISLGEAKRDMVYGRLVRRLRKLGLHTFAPYIERLERGDAAELREFVNAVTTNLTSFFREPRQFEFLQRALVPRLLAEHAHDRRLRLWSAACSTGEEPYSIAIALRESIPDIDAWDVKLLATDIDTNVLETARRGRYGEDRVRGMDVARARRGFLRGTGPHAGQVQVRPEVQRLVRFGQLNLLQAWPMRGPFDVIFCRNVVIYFDKPTQKTLFERMADMLTPAGHLFIGHSESLFKVTDRFTSLGHTIYRRIR